MIISLKDFLEKRIQLFLYSRMAMMFQGKENREHASD